MLALVNEDYKFVWVEVVTNDANSDVAIANRCKFHEYIVNNQLDIPAPEAVVPGDIVFPLIFLGDNSFAIKTYFY